MLTLVPELYLSSSDVLIISWLHRITFKTEKNIFSKVGNTKIHTHFRMLPYSEN